MIRIIRQCLDDFKRRKLAMLALSRTLHIKNIFLIGTVKNALNETRWIILPIVLFFLFSCASTRQEKTQSKDANFYNDRGIAFALKGQNDQAILDFTKVLEINSRYPQAYYNRGIVYSNKGQYDRAISDFSKALEINPRLAEAYYNRGNVYYYQKEYNKSWDDIKRAQDLGYQVPSKFLEDLGKASGGAK